MNGEQLSPTGIYGSTVPRSATDRLESEKARLQERLKAVNEALEAMQASPETAKVVDAISKLGI